MSKSRLPFASVIFGALFLLSACGGDEIVFNANPATSSTSANATLSSSKAPSSVASATSSIAPINSSIISSSSAVSATTSISSTIIVSSSSASIVVTPSSSSVASSSRASSSSIIASSSVASGPTGAQLYASKCAVCHGAQGQGGVGVELLNCSTCGNLAVLTQRILDTMPQFKPSGPYGDCDLSCSQKTAQLIFNNFAAVAIGSTQTLLKQTANSIPSYSLLSNNQSSCNTAYSANDLRPLTKQEYAASIFQLTGLDLTSDLSQAAYSALPPDNIVIEYLNGATITLDKNTQDSYKLAADKIATDLSITNFSSIVDCSASTKEECFTQLVDSFACNAFKRPLTNDERTNYLSLYSDNDTRNEGITKVVGAILSSPNFIYRSNIGLENIVRADNAFDGIDNAPSLLDNPKVIPIYEQRSIHIAFSGNDILEIKVKGTQSPSGLWPTLRLQVDGSTFVDLVVSDSTEQTYRFHVTSLTGNNSIIMTNQQTGAALEYQGGQNLIVSSLKLLSLD